MLPAVVIIAAVATGALGLTLLASPRRGRKDEPGEVVTVEFLPEDPDWIAKVYTQPMGLFEVQVLHSGDFQTKRQGFPTVEAAIGWGFRYARGLT